MFSQTNTIQEMIIPYLPPNVELSHIGPNGKLLTDEQISFLKSNFTKNGYYSKAETNLNYTIIIYEHHYFALYLGIKHKKYGEDGKALGKGSFGTVKLIQHLDTGNWYACKGQTGSYAANEVAMIEKMGHLTPTELNQKIIIFDRESKSKKGKRFYLLFNLAKGISIFDLFIQDKQLPLIKQLEIIIKMIEVVKEAYDKGILHCDIKLENMVYDDIANEIILLDFGFAKMMDENGKAIGNRVGTVEYIAPELFEKTFEFSITSEMYTLGLSIGAFLGFVYVDTIQHKTNDKMHIPRFFLVSEGSEDYDKFYKKNNRITDEMIKFDIWKYLRLLTNVDSTLRPTSYDDVLVFFQQIKNTLTIEQRTIKIGLLDIDEYQINRKRIKNLYDVDEIYLFQKTINKTPWEYANVRNHLINRGLFVSDKLFHQVKGEEFVSAIPHHIKPNHPDYVYEYYLLSSKKMVKVDQLNDKNNNNDDVNELSRKLGLFAVSSDHDKVDITKEECKVIKRNVS